MADPAVGKLTVKAPKIAVLAGGSISADKAGAAGGLRSAQNSRGGLGGAGAGASASCGGGPGSSVGQGGSGATYRGIGGAPNNPWGSATNNACDSCSEATVTHCAGSRGAAYGTPDGDDLAVGSGGGAGGNSEGCSNSGGLGGRGGGSIVLVGDAVRIDGTVSADGEQPPAPNGDVCGYRGTGGSGGVVLVSTKSLAGAVRARGGNGGEALGDIGSTTWGWAGGGGGGGRVKVFAIASTFTGSSFASGGLGGVATADGFSYAGDPGSIGTVHTGAAQPVAFTGLTCP